MKLSQTLAIKLQMYCLQNYTDTLIFDKSLRALVLMKPYLTENSLLSVFVSQGLVNTQIFIDTVDADKLTHVLNFFIVFQDYITPIQSDAIRIHIITILKMIQEQSPLSNYVGMSKTLLQLIQVTLQQHQLEFLTKSQAEELARHIANNSSYLIIPFEIARVLWDINTRFDIMNIVNDSLTNSNAIMFMIQTLLEMSKVLIQHAYEFKFSQKLTDLVDGLVTFDQIQYQKDDSLAVSSSIYITSQVMAGAPIKTTTIQRAFQHLSRSVCKTQNEQDLLSFCMEVLAQ
ncbi:Hypothetical_protein [Hexamita inflata]|uniref:Hypothetical_protein n=1 Tax=Hexamita inflata TaxID=28002 RepID=A0AA86RML6_9EUKA|nr:Hypothetical protein HINF_LOCUS62302 [Hexamita inflata]